MKYVPILICVISLLSSYYFVFSLGQKYQQNKDAQKRIEAEKKAGEKNAETFDDYEEKLRAIEKDDTPAASVIVRAIERLPDGSN